MKVQIRNDLTTSVAPCDASVRPKVTKRLATFSDRKSAIKTVSSELTP